MIVTHHAARRLRQRLGIPKRAAERHARRAFASGQTVQALSAGEKMLVEFQGWGYVFGYDAAENCPILVTVVPTFETSDRQITQQTRSSVDN